ncbi:hypothetical protein AUEXF2481DRAFT_433772 [Aureobasidium subglaciale EXF-2481]|uniref:Uncharacterized protein n=1 Tax=Aureobasidium subglaciale (strain EXF-2481) TaxID=1043005 RepID=A0A074Y399_AURSE|nr:uncharacterized protein AUEXF2481DRAFT_433772 [Aureobasidium subglaciale EXF-2481]KEQ92175.1 hypothetical protein AUEXF2481DRAFT_433772 [Aureobasidium subglaciale EXF-2481]
MILKESKEERERGGDGQNSKVASTRQSEAVPEKCRDRHYLTISTAHLDHLLGLEQQATHRLDYTHHHTIIYVDIATTKQSLPRRKECGPLYAINTMVHFAPAFHFPTCRHLYSVSTAFSLSFCSLVMENCRDIRDHHPYMKNIPYLSGEGRRDIAPDTRALNWLEDDFAQEVLEDILGDDGEKGGQTGNEKTREGKDCIPLTYRVGEGGVVLLLDIRKSGFLLSLLPFLNLLPPSLTHASFLPSFFFLQDVVVLLC